MPISQSTLADIEDAFGTGGRSGDAAPNGHNFLGALNVINNIARDMHEYGLTIDDLPAEKRTECENAHEDLQYYIQKLPHVFTSGLVGQDGAYELPDGSTVNLPRPPTDQSGSEATLPSKP